MSRSGSYSCRGRLSATIWCVGRSRACLAMDRRGTVAVAEEVVVYVGPDGRKNLLLRNLRLADMCRQRLTCLIGMGLLLCNLRLVNVNTDCLSITINKD